MRVKRWSEREGRGREGKIVGMRGEELLRREKKCGRRRRRF
jgi:hypothetical protein